MTGPPISIQKKQLIRVAVAVALGAVLVLAAFGVSRELFPSSRSSSPSLEVVTTENGTAAPVGDYAVPPEVSVFSPNPEFVGNGTNVVGNPTGASVLLYSGTAGASGTISGLLSPVFSQVAKEWTQRVPQGSRVSLLVEGVYSLLGNSTSEEFVSTNWIGYNPWSPPSSFTTTLSFDLSQPSAVEPLSGPGPACIPNGHGGCIPPGQCPNPYNGVNLVNSSSVAGPLPLSMTINQGGASNSDQSSLAETTIDQTVSLDFTGGGWTQNQSFTTDGTTPTFSSGSENISVSQLSVGADSSGQAGILSLEGATLYIQNTHPYEVYYTGSPPDCVAHDNYYPHETTAYIDGLTTSSGQYVLGAAIAQSSFANAFLNSLPVSNAGSPYTIAEGESQAFVSGLDQASGYSNANTVFSETVNALSTFDTALGAALVIIELSDACPFDTCTAAQILEATDAFSAALGVATQVASDLNTFSFSTTLHQSLQISSLTNAEQGSSPGSQTAQFFQANGLTEILGNSQPTANMPSPYVLVT
jgi:hypothetical protein